MLFYTSNKIPKNNPQCPEYAEKGDALQMDRTHKGRMQENGSTDPVSQNELYDGTRLSSLTQNHLQPCGEVAHFLRWSHSPMVSTQRINPINPMIPTATTQINATTLHHKSKHAKQSAIASKNHFQIFLFMKRPLMPPILSKM